MKFETAYVNAIPVHLIQTEQFKTLNITVRFFDALSENTVTSRHLALAMMKAKSQRYPSRKAMTKALETMYDTQFSAQSMNLGTQHINQFSFSLPAPAFTDASLLTEVFAFIKEVLHNPLFDEKSLREEKQFLDDYFKAEYTNKTRYAAKRYYEHLYKDHPYNINALGVEEKIPDVTLSDVTDAYNGMMKDNPVQISVSGDFDRERALDFVKTLPLEGRPLPKDLFIRHDFKTLTPVKETMELSQDRLFMTLRSDIYYKDEDYFPLSVFNAMFGESSESLLFREVRENHSLAYYVHSGYAPFSSLITVLSGMEGRHIEKAKTLIRQTLKRVQEGDFKDEDLILAKKHRISQIKKSYDNIRNLSLKGLRHSLFNVPFEETSHLEAIDMVSREDIIRVANTLTWVFTYVLGSENNETN